MFSLFSHVSAARVVGDNFIVEWVLKIPDYLYCFPYFLQVCIGIRNVYYCEVETYKPVEPRNELWTRSLQTCQNKNPAGIYKTAVNLFDVSYTRQSTFQNANSCSITMCELCLSIIHLNLNQCLSYFKVVEAAPKNNNCRWSRYFFY